MKRKLYTVRHDVMPGHEHKGAVADCAICNNAGTEQPRAASRPRTVKVRARDEDFRIVQLQGNLFVCSKAHGNCCCGWTEKGRAPINIQLYEAEWEHRKIRNQLHLTFTGCLGPCAVGNNAMLQVLGRSIWLKDLNDDRFIPLIFDYAEAILRADRILPPSGELEDHVYERYLSPPDATYMPLVEEGTASESDGLERLDPVCLMDVDPATARYKLEYQGRMIHFCAPSCKKAFERDPTAYLVS
jgi:YHS domain-containing protein